MNTNKTTQINLEECWPCPVFANYTLAFALQLRKKHGKNLSQSSRSSQGSRRYGYIQAVVLVVLGADEDSYKYHCN
jgi:hypothetical protein